MTSNTTPVPFVVSASSYYASSYEPYRAFDGNDSTAWASSTSEDRTKSWLQIDFGKKVNIYGIEIASRNNSYWDQAPTQIYFDISDNEQDYQEFPFSIHTEWTGPDRKIFIFDSVMDARFVKLNKMTSISTGYKVIGIGDIKFLM